MKLSDFDYSLPKELIAQVPLSKRDSSRLLVVDRHRKTISHYFFSDLINFIKPQDLLVLNDTKVLKYRLAGFKKDTFGKVDVLLTNKLSNRRYQVLSRPYLKIGQEVIFGSGLIKAKVVSEKTLQFSEGISSKTLDKIGVMPLPPYIKRFPSKEDVSRYQTVYAKNLGSIASPTAGLHFSTELLAKIKKSSINIAYVTLNVGLGTFKPVKALNIREHRMEEEEFKVSAQALKLLNETKRNKKRIFAVGTTAARTIETVANMEVLPLRTVRGRTNLFIYPGYKFKMVDCLLTNFHLPKTTLFMLVCAFAGRDLIVAAYQEAIKARYRFYSYGDAMLII